MVIIRSVQNCPWMCQSRLKGFVPGSGPERDINGKRRDNFRHTCDIICTKCSVYSSLLPVSRINRKYREVSHPSRSPALGDEGERSESYRSRSIKTSKEELGEETPRHSPSTKPILCDKRTSDGTQFPGAKRECYDSK